MRRQLLQGPLDAVLVEARLLRARLELWVTAHQLAVRELRVARLGRRPVRLDRAERIF